jgi:hypothetical protein
LFSVICNSAAAKAEIYNWLFCGTTEVMPCYKAAFTTGYQGHFEIVEVVLFTI